MRNPFNPAKTELVVGKKQKPEVGHTYRFVYNKQVRVALCLEDEGDGMLCHDFTKCDYRNFKYNQIEVAQDVTNSVKVLNHFNEDDVELHEEAGCSVFQDFDNDKLYAVRLKSGVNATAN